MKKIFKKRYKYERFQSYIIVCIFLVILIGLARYFSSDDLRLQYGDVYSLNDGWTIEDGMVIREDINLSQELDVPVGQIIEISKVLPEDFSDSKTLRLRSSMQKVTVFLDEELIYDNTDRKSDQVLYNTEASTWILIDLPKNSDGRLLRILISSGVSVMSGRINGVFYGHRGDLIANLLAHQLVSVCIVLLSFSVGIFAFFASLFFTSHKVQYVNHLCIFSFAIGVWLISEIDIMQLITGNSYIVGAISYVMLPVATIAFIHFINDMVIKQYCKLLKGISIFFYLYLIISMVAQLIFNIHYIISLKVFNVALLLTVVLIVGLLIYETFVHHDGTARKYLVFISLLVVTTVIETIMFLIGDFTNISALSNIGIGLFLLLITFDSAKYLNNIILQEGEAKYLKEIVYKDVLTQGLNRTAFEKDIDELMTAKDKKPFRLIMFDINNLKIINDNYGHEVGDHALRDFYQGLQQVYGGDGRCYRIGGDEFIVILFDISEEVHVKYVEWLKEYMKDIELSKSYLFQTAYGSDVYNYESSFGVFKHEVDLKMYQEKFRMKGLS
jgi:diguanylate cyclase (GGDEF)-like protein